MTVDEFWGGGADLVNEIDGRDQTLKNEILRLRAAGEWKA